MMRIHLRRVVEQRHLADALLCPGEAVLVDRVVPRSLVLRCPDDCGEILTINLDPRSGKAWRLDRGADGTFSLFPSVWRTHGCRAHFIIWRSGLYSVGRDYLPIRRRSNVENQILNVLADGMSTPLKMADVIDEDPWMVAVCLETLATRGVVQLVDNERDIYRIVPE